MGLQLFIKQLLPQLICDCILHEALPSKLSTIVIAAAADLISLHGSTVMVLYEANYPFAVAAAPQFNFALAIKQCEMANINSPPRPTFEPN